MERLQRASILLRLNEELRKSGSWAGETHMQKTTFFLQELLDVPLGFDFVLYKHGPFSFDLRDELTFMRAQGFFQLEPQYPYGPSLVAGAKGELLSKAFGQPVEQYAARIRFVSQKLGAKTVAELERTATALYISLREPRVADVGERLTSLKPHISLPEARAAQNRYGCLCTKALATLGFVSPGVFTTSLVLSAAAIYVLALLCGFYPGRLATRIHPAEALHYD